MPLLPFHINWCPSQQLQLNYEDGVIKYFKPKHYKNIPGIFTSIKILYTTLCVLKKAPPI